MKTIVLGVADFYLQRLRRNYPGYLEEFRWYLSALFLATLADAYSTQVFMAGGEIGNELHPGIRLASQLFGPYAGPLLGKLSQFAAVLFLTLLFRAQARMLFIPVTVVYLYAAWFNLWGCEGYTPVFVKLFSPE
jgi:hypothetical protein